MHPTDVAFAPDALTPTPTVRVRWLGTAGFAIEHDGQVLLIDPYLTRAPLWRVATTRLVPDLALLAATLPRACAIVVGHTHFDHALDVPALARQTGARVFGSRSAAALCVAQGVPAAQVEVVEAATAQVREIGPFRLTFEPSAHSRFALGRVPFPGEIADCDAVPMRAPAYRCGAVFGVEIAVAGRTIYHLGSAELVEAQLRPRTVDLALLCVAGWTSSHELPERVARYFNPRAVLLSHWDNFFSPLGHAAHALPAMQLPRLVDRLTSAARDVRLGTLPLLGELWL